MMRLLITFIATSYSLSAFAQWTAQQTLKAKVWSYDRNCVELKLTDGQSIRVKKNAVDWPKLEPRKTVIEFHLDVLEKDLCPN